MQTGFNATNQFVSHQQQVNATYSGYTQNYNTPYLSHQQPQMYHNQNDNGQCYHPTTSYYQHQAGYGQQLPQSYYNSHQYPMNQNYNQTTSGLF